MSKPSGITIAISAMAVLRAIKVVRDVWSVFLDISSSLQWIRSTPDAKTIRQG
jgi:hypothetical protein